VTRLLVATTNPGKQREFRRLLNPLPAVIVTPDGIGLDLEVAEPHETYAANAVAKAAAFARASGLISVADDSGIEVAALDWAPGVRSARWAGDKGREADRLLEALEGVADRRARMVCALAVAAPGTDGEPVVETFAGVMDGTVATARRGSGGFGYDPVFLVDGTTTAELPDDEKDRISHRGRAVSAALPRLRELLAEY
jgi:XTP/dITP diphosphohydrolase